MAEQDDLDFGYNAPRRHRPNATGERLFEDNPRVFEDVLDDYSSESANDEYLEGAFDDSDFMDDDFEGEYGQLDDDDFEYLSTPPGAFLKACLRTLQHAPRIDTELDSTGQYPVHSSMSQDRGPSYSL